ncbi:hypothetical protein FOA52_016139 [Chlamydomonas sp. UWO 241]|nr:hypothetical protein FOA52_016139 [Chlamydomonas sp. UWO 241]
MIRSEDCSDTELLAEEEELAHEASSSEAAASSERGRGSSSGEEDDDAEGSSSDDDDAGSEGGCSGRDGIDDNVDMECEAGSFCTNCTAPFPFGSDLCEDCGHTRSADGELFCGDAAAERAGGCCAADAPVALLWDERMELHQEGRSNPHPERPDRIRAVMARLLSSGLASRCTRVECRQATVAELAAVHTQGLIKLVEEASHAAAGAPDSRVAITPDTYVNEHTHLCARLAAGGAAEVAALVARGHAPHGAAIVRPPGHHAESGMAMGFCFFNSAAVAARAAQAAGARRVLILDWDIHHGNGTQHIFEHDPSVLYMSLHRHDHGQFFPGTGGAGEVGIGEGEGFTVNVPWDAADIANGDYLCAFNQVLVPIAYEFNPDLIIVSAGFDAADGDPIGQCRVTPEGFGHMTAMLKVVAPTVLLLEGGYNLNATAEASEACLRVLLGESPGCLPGPRHASTLGCRGIQQAIQAQARYWKCLRATSELLSVRQPLGAAAGAAAAAAGGVGASAQPSDDTQQIPPRSTTSGGGGASPSSELVAPRHHRRQQVVLRGGSAAAAKSRVLLAIHKRAMRAFWQRKCKRKSPHAPAATHA